MARTILKARHSTRLEEADAGAEPTGAVSAPLMVRTKQTASRSTGAVSAPCHEAAAARAKAKAEAAAAKAKADAAAAKAKAGAPLLRKPLAGHSCWLGALGRADGHGPISAMAGERMRRDWQC